MVNDSKTCREPFCDGRMTKTGERKFRNEHGDADEVVVYACTECGAEDWDG